MSEADITFTRLNIDGLAILGLWDKYHFESPIKAFLYKLYGSIAVAYLIIFNISQFIQMYYHKDDAVQLIQNFGVTFLFTLVLLKAGTVLYRKEQIRGLLDQIRFAEERVFQRPEKEIEIYNDAIKWNVFLTKGFGISCLLATIGFLFSRPVEYWFLGKYNRG